MCSGVGSSEPHSQWVESADDNTVFWVPAGMPTVRSSSAAYPRAWHPLGCLMAKVLGVWSPGVSLLVCGLQVWVCWCVVSRCGLVGVRSPGVGLLVCGLQV